MSKENQILTELLNEVENWSDLKTKLEKYNTSQTESTSKKTQAGKIFEVFTKYYLQTDPKKTELYKSVWLYDEVSTEIRKELSLPSIDHGIDLLLQDFDNNYHAVQCKFKNDETKSLSWSGDKIANVFALGTNCHKIIVFTNASDTTSVAKAFEQKFEQIAFDELNSIEPEIFKNILDLALGNRPKALKKHTPKEHQQIAIDKVIEHFETKERGQLILPCGAGKTVTALWIKEKIQSKTTLVLVPSLALLKQIKNDWARHKTNPYSYLCVCSEKDIDKDQDDAIRLHTYEIGGPVTTDFEKVKMFLQKDCERIIFSTYQSIEVIVNAVKRIPGFAFGLIICDEAHRTAGSRDKNTFTLVHDNKKIPALKRLYMTATPKIVSKKLKRKLGEEYDLFCDMSNPRIFGEEAFHMNFGDAITRKILVDYKIIGIGVSDLQIKKHIEERKYLGDYTAEELANNYALELVMNNYNAFHSISFHSKVKFAEAFAERHKDFFENIYAKSVNGNQTTTYRSKILHEFKESQKGLVSNARCLTEGVDVPSIDLIYFCDPKTSVIDIVQASGRALRLDPSGKKEWGYIVVPIFHHEDQDVETEIKKKPIFEHLIQVIRSLCDHDERLRAEINEIAFKKGKRTNSRIKIDFSNSNIEKIIKLEGIEEKVRDVLFDEIIEKTYSNWELRFLEIKDYIEKNGHSTISKKNTEYSELYYWVGNQRKNYYDDKLEHSKIKRLNEIGFDWKGENRREITDLDEIWKESYNKLVEYFTKHSNSDVPARYKKDKSLGTWVVSQRVKRKEGRLEEWQIKELDKLKFNWKPKNRFNDFVNALEKYYQDNGNYFISQSESRYGNLPRWVNSYRSIHNTGVLDAKGNIVSKGGKLLKEQVEYLDSINFVWSERVSWDERLKQLTEYFQINGHSNVSTSEDIALYTWCNHQKNNKDNLDDVQLEKLQTVNFSYEINRSDTDERFLEKLIELSDYHKKNGTFYIDNQDKEYSKLRYWFSTIKRDFNNNSLSDDKIQLLKEIGLDLVANSYNLEEEQWNEKFEIVKSLHSELRTFRFPKEKKYNSIRSWLLYQRSLYKKNELKPERQKLLSEIGFPLIAGASGNKSAGQHRAEQTWIQRVGELKEYFAANSTYYIGLADKEHESLRLWIQRIKRFYREGKLTEEQINELQELNFDFTNNWGNRKLNDISKIWLNHFEEFRKYYTEKGTFYISKQDENYSKLYSWVLVQRTNFNQGKLETEKIKHFDSIGYSLTTNYYPKQENNKVTHADLWDTKLEELKEYYNANNSFFIPLSDIEHRKLLSWLRVQRSNFKNQTLEPDRIKKLQDAGYSFDTTYYGYGKEKKENEPSQKEANVNQAWENNYMRLINYKIANGHCNVPRTYKEDKTLAHFVARQRFNYKNGKLSQDRIMKLELINFEWELPQNSNKLGIWMSHYSDLLEVYNKVGSVNLTKSQFESSLYNWILQQRGKKRKNLLLENQIALLDKIGFNWDPESAGSSPDDKKWLTMFEQLKNYKKIYGDCNVSQLNQEYKSLGRWVNDQRLNYSRNKLKENRKELLEETGFIWNLKEYEFDMKIKLLQEFYQKNGHFNVRQSDKEFTSLYNLIFRIKKNGTSSERIEKLRRIGFDTIEIQINENN